MEHLSNDQKDHAIQHKNSQKLCNEKGLKEIQWKLRQPLDQNFPMVGKEL